MIWFDGDFTVAEKTGVYRETFPFPGDTESRVIEQDYIQLLSDRVPLELDTPHDEFLDCYLVEETTPKSVGGGVVRWTRVYQSIPKSRTEVEVFAYTLPGISADEVSLQKVISSYSVVSGKWRIETSTAHGYSDGTPVIIFYTVPDPQTFIVYPRQAYRTVQGTPSDTTHFDILPIIETKPITLQQCFANLYGREPFTLAVPSFLQYDYFLPGVSAGVANVTDIEIYRPILIIDGTGNVTDSYASTTVPSKLDYRAQVAAGSLIVAEPSSLQRLRGNIYERATRYITAI